MQQDDHPIPPPRDINRLTCILDSHPFKWKYYYRIEYGTISLMRPSSRSPTNSERGSKITVPLFSRFLKIWWSEYDGISSDWKRLEVIGKFSILNWVSENYSCICSLGLYRELQIVRWISGKFMKKQTILGRKKSNFLYKKISPRNSPYLLKAS